MTSSIKKLFMGLLALAVPVAFAATISVWQPGGDLATSSNATTQTIANGAINLGGAKVTGTLPVNKGGMGAATFSGVLKGNGTSAISSAASSDIRSLWSGTCDITSFLRGDGTCATVLTAVAGSNTQVQYNNSSALGASANFTWTNGTSTVSTGSLAITGTTAPAAGIYQSAGPILRLTANSGTANLALSSTSLQLNQAAGFVLLDSTAGDSPNIELHRSGGTTSDWTFIIPTGTSNLDLFDAGALNTRWAQGGDVTFTNSANAKAFIPNNAAVPSNGMYLPAANTVGWSTNTTAHGQINSAGNWSIPSPTSGTTLALTGVANGNQLTTTDGTISAGLATTGGTKAAWGTTSNHGLSLYTNNTERVAIGNGGGIQVGAPTGGNLGAGTINSAGNIAINNVSVCRADGTNCFPVLKAKAADTDRSSTTTLTDDPDLVTSSVAAGTYEVVGKAIYSELTSVTQNFKSQIAFSGTVTSSNCYVAQYNGVVTAISMAGLVNTNAVFTGVAPSTDYLAEWHCSAVVSTSGVWSLQWSQGTSNANATRLRSGSSFQVLKTN